MRRSVLFSCGMLAIGLSFLIVSCGNEGKTVEPFSEESKNVQQCTTQDQAYSLLVNYLVLKDQTYVLDISAEEAKKIGVPTVYYEMAVKELAETNRQIKEVLKDTTTEFIWADPQMMLGENAITSVSPSEEH